MPFSVKDRKATIELLQEDLQTCSPKEREQKVHSIQMLYALESFHEKSYSQAMSEFLRLNADPFEIVKLFPRLSHYTGKRWNFIKDKNNSVRYLIWYLEKYKVKLSNETFDTTDGLESERQQTVKRRLEFVNTTLLKWYLLTDNDALLSHIQNYDINFSVAEKLLRVRGKHYELLVLYKKNGLHRKALQYLKSEAKKQEHTNYRYDDIKKYLQHLGPDDIKVIIQFTDWIVKESPYVGLAIFTEVIIEAEKLPRAIVLDYLTKENKLLAIPYLEHVIHKWKDTNKTFHDTLIDLYIEEIHKMNTDLLKRQRDELHYRLLIFLEQSVHYNPKRVVMIIPKDGFLEEKAILYGRLGNYDDALIIFVYLLEDLDKAVQYCDKMYNTKNDNARNIYLKLIRLLLKKLKQADSKMLDMDCIFDILENNASRISVMDVLAELPDTVPLYKLKRFLHYALETQFAVKHGLQIYKSLSYVESLQVTEELKKCKLTSFELTNKMKCPVCKKPFGNQKSQAAFLRYPNGEIVHILCDTKRKAKLTPC